MRGRHGPLRGRCPRRTDWAEQATLVRLLVLAGPLRARVGTCYQAMGLLPANARLDSSALPSTAYALVLVLLSGAPVQPRVAPPGRACRCWIPRLATLPVGRRRAGACTCASMPATSSRMLRARTQYSSSGPCRSPCSGNTSAHSYARYEARCGAGAATAPPKTRPLARAALANRGSAAATGLAWKEESSRAALSYECVLACSRLLLHLGPCQLRLLPECESQCEEEHE